jgi:signal transduction histidine kinase
MRLATKLTLLLLLPVALVMAVFGYLRAQQERDRQIAEFRQEVLVLAHAVKRAVEYSLRDRQPQDIRALVAELVREPNPVARIRAFSPRLEEIAGASSPAQVPQIPQAELESVLAGGPPVVRYLDLPVRPVAYALLPLHGRQDRVIGVLELVHPATRVQRQIAEGTREQIVRLSVLSLSLALLIWLIVRITIRRPIAELVQTALALGHGNLTQRSGLRRRDEIGQLARAFNQMAERLQGARDQLVAQGQARLDLERQVQHAEKLAALGRVATEMAHEVGTPLNVISGRTSLIQHGLPPDHPLHRHVETVLRQVERISAILRQLLDYARPRQPAVRRVALAPLVHQIVDLLEPVAKRRAIRLVSDIPAETPLLVADPDQLQQVLINLVTNALDATAAAGEVRLFTGEPVLPAGPSVRRGSARPPTVGLVVEDTGSGIPVAQLERIFEPFFTTKKRLAGTGLGLAIVEDILAAHQAGIEVRSLEGRGTAVRLEWPAGDPAGPAVVLVEARAPEQER